MERTSHRFIRKGGIKQITRADTDNVDTVETFDQASRHVGDNSPVQKRLRNDNTLKSIDNQFDSVTYVLRISAESFSLRSRVMCALYST